MIPNHVKEWLLHTNRLRVIPRENLQLQLTKFILAQCTLYLNWVVTQYIAGSSYLRKGDEKLEQEQDRIQLLALVNTIMRFWAP
jgi:hypothetical protein